MSMNAAVTRWPTRTSCTTAAWLIDPIGTTRSRERASLTGIPRYRGTTMVTSCPRRLSASGNAPATSASPPVLANGCASGVTITIDNLLATGAAVVAVFRLAAFGVEGFFGARARDLAGAGAAAAGPIAAVGGIGSGLGSIARGTLRVVRARGVGVLSGVVDWARAGVLRDGFFFSSGISTTSGPHVQKRKFYHVRHPVDFARADSSAFPFAAS